MIPGMGIGNKSRISLKYLSEEMGIYHPYTQKSFSAGETLRH